MKLPPEIYGDWLEFFEYLKTSQPVDVNVLKQLGSGGHRFSPSVQTAYEEQLVKAINVMLNKRISRFNRELNLLLEFNDTEKIVPTFKKLTREIGECMFFDNLNNLDDNMKERLKSLIQIEVGNMWNAALEGLNKHNQSGVNYDLEYAVKSVRRMKPQLSTFCGGVYGGL